MFHLQVAPENLLIKPTTQKKPRAKNKNKICRIYFAEYSRSGTCLLDFIFEPYKKCSAPTKSELLDGKSRFNSK